jgi:hypothetical protein
LLQSALVNLASDGLASDGNGATYRLRSKQSAGGALACFRWCLLWNNISNKEHSMPWVHTIFILLLWIVYCFSIASVGCLLLLALLLCPMHKETGVITNILLALLIINAQRNSCPKEEYITSRLLLLSYYKSTRAHSTFSGQSQKGSWGNWPVRLIVRFDWSNHKYSKDASTMSKRRVYYIQVTFALIVLSENIQRSMSRVIGSQIPSYTQHNPICWTTYHNGSLAEFYLSLLFPSMSPSPLP